MYQNNENSVMPRGIDAPLVDAVHRSLLRYVPNLAKDFHMKLHCLIVCHKLTTCINQMPKAQRRLYHTYFQGAWENSLGFISITMRISSSMCWCKSAIYQLFFMLATHEWDHMHACITLVKTLYQGTCHVKQTKNLATVSYIDDEFWSLQPLSCYTFTQQPTPDALNATH